MHGDIENLIALHVYWQRQVLPVLPNPARHTVTSGINALFAIDLDDTNAAAALCTERRAQRCPNAVLQPEYPGTFIGRIDIAICAGGHAVNGAAIHSRQSIDMGQARSILTCQALHGAHPHLSIRKACNAVDGGIWQAFTGTEYVRRHPAKRRLWWL